MSKYVVCYVHRLVDIMARYARKVMYDGALRAQSYVCCMVARYARKVIYICYMMARYGLREQSYLWLH